MISDQSSILYKNSATSSAFKAHFKGDSYQLLFNNHIRNTLKWMPGIAARIYNLRIQEAEAGGFWVQGLDYTGRSCLKNKIYIYTHICMLHCRKWTKVSIIRSSSKCWSLCHFNFKMVNKKSHISSLHHSFLIVLLCLACNTRDWTRAVTVNYIPNPFLVFYFWDKVPGSPWVSRLGSNLQSACLSLSEWWDYKSVLCS